VSIVSLKIRLLGYALALAVALIGTGIGSVFGEPILGAAIAATILFVVSYGMRTIKP
jgi:hypothetical protein